MVSIAQMVPTTTLRRLPRRGLPYVLALLAVAATTGVLLPFRPHLNLLNLGLIYLIVITLLALRTAVWPSIVASVWAFLCFDFFFVLPYSTLTVAEPDHLLALVVFLGAAVLVTQLVRRLRRQTDEALRRGRQTATLYDLSTTLIGEVGLDQTLGAIVERVREVFALDTCAILMEQDGELAPRALSGEQLNCNDRNLLGLASWVMRQRQPAGIGSGRARVVRPTPPARSLRRGFSPERPHRPLLLLPISTLQRSLGVLLVARDPGRPEFDPEEGQLLETFANHAALAIERDLLTAEQMRAAVLSRSDELKSALLSAVSHDLRTPLASIKASATSLLQPGVVWTEEDRHDLLLAINEEADRLNGLVANLLDLSRIEAGALRPELAWYDLSEAVYAAVDRSEALLRNHRLTIDLPADLPLLRFDFIEIVQVVVNLLGNAAKYAPADTAITLAAVDRGAKVELTVRDEGVGIPRGEEERIFDKFYRVEAPHRPIGSGMGLALCRGFIEAHGGRIWAERNADRGATFHVTLPVEAPDETSPAPAIAR